MPDCPNRSFIGLLKNASRPVRLQTYTVYGSRIYVKSEQEVGISGQLQHPHLRDPLTALFLVPFQNVAQIVAQKLPYPAR